jgi:hypothetical protein
MGNFFLRFEGGTWGAGGKRQEARGKSGKLEIGLRLLVMAPPYGLRFPTSIIAQMFGFDNYEFLVFIN